MTWRKIAVYYALSLVLGSYYFLFEWRPDADKPIRGPRAVQQSRFLPIARDDVHELVLQSQGVAIHTRKTGQNWEILEPAGVNVTSALFESLVELLTSDKGVQVVDQSTVDFASYGLAQPHATIQIIGANKNTTTTIYVGDRNPTESAVYARKEDSPQVVLLGYSVRYYGDLIFESAGLNKK